MYIQDLIAKTHPSRISLTYATTVNGEPEVIDLPFRMLVLGNFTRNQSSQAAVPLEERPTHQLTGANLDDVLRAMSLTLTLSRVQDKVSRPPRAILVTCTTGGPLGAAAFSAFVGADKATKPCPVKGDLGWTAVVLDAPSTAKTTLRFDDDQGEFRAGDAFIVTPASKVLRARTNVGGGELEVVGVTTDNTLPVRLPLTGMSSFTPDEIARNVPAIAALRRVKKLLIEMQADLDNRRDLRATLNGLLGNADLKKALRASTYQPLRLLPTIEPPAPPTPPTPPPANGQTAAPPDPIDLGPFDLDFAPDTDLTAPSPSVAAGAKPDAMVATLLKQAGLDGTTSPFPTLTASLDELDKPTLPADVHFVARLAALVNNVYVPPGRSLNKSRVLDAIAMIDDLVNVQMNEILHDDDFKAMAAVWGALENLVDNTDFSDQIRIDVLDCSQAELQEDFDSNQSDIFSGALFKKIYIDEYDQYGGLPYGAMIGLYEFGNTPAHLRWLRQMAKVANASHAPFVAAATPAFFGCDTADEVAAIKDIRGLLGQPQYGNWSDFRDQPEAAYIGLALPHFMLRAPWNKDTNPCDDLATFSEVTEESSDSYLWGNPAVLVARNLLRSFNESGWCQYLRGPKGGGRITALPAAFYELHDHDVLKPPVEITIPDYREYEFAQSGFIPLILKKDSTEATFFSVQSV
jgi:type VI secretion system protein ImpC